MVDVAWVIRRTLALGVGVALLALAVAVVANPVTFVVSQHQQVGAAQPVEATVVSSSATTDVTEYTELDSRPSGSLSFRSVTRVETDHYAVVRYRYTVDGETYTSSTVRPPGTGSAGVYGTGSRSAAESFVDRYPENATVTAYVVPSDPQTSFLVKDPVNPLWLLVVLVPASLPAVLGTLLVGGGLGLVDPQGTWKSRLGGYLATLFSVGPAVGVAAVTVLLTPRWANPAGIAAGLLLFGAVLYYTGRMMLFGQSAKEVGLVGGE